MIDARGVLDLFDGIVCSKNNDAMMVIIERHECAKPHVMLHLGIEELLVPFDHFLQIASSESIVADILALVFSMVRIVHCRECLKINSICFAPMTRCSILGIDCLLFRRVRSEPAQGILS